SSRVVGKGLKVLVSCQICPIAIRMVEIPVPALDSTVAQYRSQNRGFPKSELPTRSLSVMCAGNRRLPRADEPSECRIMANYGCGNGKAQQTRRVFERSFAGPSGLCEVGRSARRLGGVYTTRSIG